MPGKITGKAELIHDAKRVYVYSYGPDSSHMDGKITISKRILSAGEIDFVEALEKREIEIDNASQCVTKVYIPPVEVDEVALSLLGRIIDAYESEHAMPSSVEK